MSQSDFFFFSFFHADLMSDPVTAMDFSRSVQERYWACQYFQHWMCSFTWGVSKLEYWSTGSRSKPVLDVHSYTSHCQSRLDNSITACIEELTSLPQVKAFLMSQNEFSSPHYCLPNSIGKFIVNIELVLAVHWDNSWVDSMVDWAVPLKMNFRRFLSKLSWEYTIPRYKILWTA